MKTFKQWMSAATADEKKALAQRALTSVDVLYQIVGAYRTGGRISTTPELAKRIELASDGEVSRTTLCQACGACEYARAHLTKKV